MCDGITSIILLIFVAHTYVVSGFPFFSNDCTVPPKECPNDNITFYLYTKSTADSPTKMTVDDPSSIRNAPLIRGAPLKFLIHGYTGSKDFTPNMELRPAYFQSFMNVNILSIDYSPLVRDGCYLQAVANVELVGMCAAQFLDLFLDLRPDVKMDHIHVIAMSLGAHVSSQLKLFLKRGLLPRITGLDAAAPLFYAFITPEARYLNKGDAIVVDAIHTDGRFKGKYLPFADIDFYVNGGFSQPDCGSNDSCSHARAAEIYAESINSKVGFLGHECSFYTRPLGACNGVKTNWNIIGENTDLENLGTFFVNTNEQPPFAQGLPPEYQVIQVK